MGKERWGGGSYSLDNCRAAEELAPNRHQIISVPLYIPYSFMVEEVVLGSMFRMSSLLGDERTGEDGDLLESVVDPAVHLHNGHSEAPCQDSTGQPADQTRFI